MINEEEVNFVRCYNDISTALYEMESFEDLDGLGGVIKAIVEVAEDYSFDKNDLKDLIDRYVLEIYG